MAMYGSQKQKSQKWLLPLMIGESRAAKHELRDDQESQIMDPSADPRSYFFGVLRSGAYVGKTLLASAYT